MKTDFTEGLRSKSMIKGSRNAVKTENREVVAAHSSEWLVENVVPEVTEEASYKASFRLGFTHDLPNFSSLRFDADLGGSFPASINPKKVARQITRLLIEELSIMAKEAGLSAGFEDFVRRKIR